MAKVQGTESKEIVFSPWVNYQKVLFNQLSNTNKKQSGKETSMAIWKHFN